MFKQPQWIRGAEHNKPAWIKLNHLLLDNTRTWFRYTASSEHSLSAEITQTRDISQHTGAIQGGVITLGCETIACMAATLCVPDNHVVVATGIHTHYIKPCTDSVTLETRCVHSGRRSAVWHVNVTDKTGKTCATSTVDMAVLRQR